MSPDYRNITQNRFRYKLEGWSEDSWHIFENGNKVSFNSLPPGNYKLRVQVSVAGSDWSTKEWHTNIKVNKPWYQTLWFYFLSLIAVAGILYLLYRNRIHQIMRIQQIRNRISADMHDEIGSTLSSITFYSQALLMQMDETKYKEVVHKIKGNAQQVQEGLSDIVWSVKAGMDEAENVFTRMLSFGSELLESKNIQFHFERDEALEHEKLDMAERKNFYLIFKEALNNAAKYSECKNIYVQIKNESGHIKMIIKDDGKGFNKQHTKQSNGLSNMQQRAAQIKGTLTVSTHENSGTTITLIF
jgi:signal transduction histidine kinase